MKMIKARKLTVYVGLLIATLLVVAMFITAVSYFQLGIATILYPILVYVIYKVLLYGDNKVSFETPLITSEDKHNTATQKDETIEVIDIDKRKFLKLICATGISFFLYSLFNKNGGISQLGQVAGLNTKKSTESSDNEAKLPDNYLISEIDNQGEEVFYGFINKDGEWFIMKGDGASGSFRYTKGDLDFPENWNNRKNLKYDYCSNVF